MDSDLAEFFRKDAQFSQGYVEHNSYQAGGVERWKKTGQELGRGSFGVVTLEIEETQGTKRAVKSLLKSQSAPDRLHHELGAVALLSKYPDSFARFLGWYEDDKYLYLALEYFEHRDLGSCVSAPIPENDVRIIARQLLQALDLMHKTGYTHRDLKPQNIFVVSMSSPNWKVKIGDFGVSKRIRTKQTVLQTRTGTDTYIAPEILKLSEDQDSDDDDDAELSSDCYTNAVDIWSLGCTIFELLTYKKPFKKNSHVMKYAESRSEFPVAELSDRGLSNECVTFVKALMSPNPENRPSARSALKMAWFTNRVSTIIVDPRPVNFEAVLHALYEDFDATRNLLSKAEKEYRVATTVLEDDDLDRVPDLVDDLKRSPLQLAAIHGREDFIQYLIDQGATIDGANSRALHRAAEQGNQKAIQVLLNHGASINEIDTFGRTALMLAVANRHGGVVQFLLDKQADVLLKSYNDGYSAVHIAAIRNSRTVLKSLLEAGAGIEERTAKGCSPLLIAVACRNNDLVDLLLQKGAHIDAADGKGWTTLHCAASEDIKDMVDMLAARGANLEATNDESVRPLHIAAANGATACVRALLNHRANIDAETVAGISPFMVAAMKGQNDVVKLLIENHARVQQRDNLGQTALHFAAGKGQVEVIRVLLANGAESGALTNEGETALDFARTENHEAVIELLLEDQKKQRNYYQAKQARQASKVPTVPRPRETATTNERLARELAPRKRFHGL